MSLLAALAAAVAVGLVVPGTGAGLARLASPAPPRSSRWRAARRWRPGERRRMTAEQARVIEFAAALAAEVRAGRAPRAAVVAAVDGLSAPGASENSSAGPAAGSSARAPAGPWPDLRQAAAGEGDVGAALDAAATQDGAAELRDVAACWRVAERTGAGLGAALEEVAAAAGERSAHRARVHAQLAGVRTTGWLLAGLPLVGMVLAALAGARPWRVLLGTTAGLGLLALGLALDAAGVAWLYRMARRVEAVA